MKKKSIIAVCFSISLLLLCGCHNEKQAFFLPVAIQFRDALAESNVWAEVIHYTYEDSNTNKKHKHAVVMFKYPSHASDVRLYDKDGSRRIFDLYYINKINVDQHAKDIALRAEQSKNNHHHSIIEAELIK